MLSPLFFTIAPELPAPTLFFGVNLTVTVASATLLWRHIHGNHWRLLRPTVMLALMLHVLFQWSLLFYSNSIEQSFFDYWWFASVIHLTVLCQLGWAMLTRQLDVPQAVRYAPHVNVRYYWINAGLILVLAGLYLSKVPWKCTALYALLFDPHLTLLARELNIKLVGKSVAVYAYGALANAVGPSFVFMCFLVLVHCLKTRKRFLLGLGALLLLCLAIVTIMLTGTKGMLLPSMLALVVGSFFIGDRLLFKIGLACMSLLLLFAMLTLFEVGKDRGGKQGASYDFADCSLALHVCQQSEVLIQSLTKRDMSLGLSKSIVCKINNRLAEVCHNESIMMQCPKGEEFIPTERPIGSTGSTGARAYAIAIFNRAFAIPIQVASWHFFYAEAEKPGFSAIPLVGYFVGTFQDPATAVYQKYGTIYSNGDKTSTSTSPASYLLTYAAYLGAYGLLLALALTCSFDLVWSFTVLKTKQSVLPIAMSFTTVISMNFIVSDFTAVLGAHGAVAALVMLMLACRVTQKADPA